MYMPITRRTPMGWRRWRSIHFAPVSSCAYHAINVMSILLPFSIWKVAIIPQRMASWSLLEKKDSTTSVPTASPTRFLTALLSASWYLTSSWTSLWILSSKACILGVITLSTESAKSPNAAWNLSTVPSRVAFGLACGLCSHLLATLCWLSSMDLLPVSFSLACGICTCLLATLRWLSSTGARARLACCTTWRPLNLFASGRFTLSSLVPCFSILEHQTCFDHVEISQSFGFALMFWTTYWTRCSLLRYSIARKKELTRKSPSMLNGSSGISKPGVSSITLKIGLQWRKNVVFSRHPVNSMDRWWSKEW